MTTKDYGIPIGYSCDGCEQDGAISSTHSWGCYEHGIHRQIPVFAVIPKGERPTTHDPDDETVLFGGNLRCGRHRAGQLTSGHWLCCDDMGSALRFVEVETIADAVLWVAEGKR